MKIGDKRWNKKTEDLEEYRKCDTCGVEFWAGSEFEYGNFYSDCDKCRKVKDKEISEWNEEYRKWWNDVFVAKKKEAEKIKKWIEENEENIKRLNLK